MGMAGRYYTHNMYQFLLNVEVAPPPPPPEEFDLMLLIPDVWFHVDKLR